MTNQKGRMMKILAWFENHRDDVEVAVNVMSYFAWISGLVFVRTITGAGTILLYLFFTATPETTVYQLAQNAHTENFWIASAIMAVIYSAFHMAVSGSLTGHGKKTHSYSIATTASSSSGPMKSTDKS